MWSSRVPSLTHTDHAIKWSTHALNESYWHVKKCFHV